MYFVVEGVGRAVPRVLIAREVGILPRLVVEEAHTDLRVHL
jgi:hypothetical protein